LTDASDNLRLKKKGRILKKNRTKKVLSIFTLPGDFIANTTAYIGSTFTELYPLVALVIGLPLAFWAIRKVISLVRAK
jgi:hypothetical protein